MANICQYKVIVKGKKNACYAFYWSMSVLDGIWIEEESGDSDNYQMRFEGSCKWSVDSYCGRWEKDYNITIPETEIEAQGYCGITVQERSKLFGVEVLCNSADIDDSGFEIFDHYINGESAGGICPEELNIFEKPEEGFRRCVVCGCEYPEEECITIDDGDTWFCQDCHSETFEGMEDFDNEEE